MITQIEGCGSNNRHSNHMKHHVKFTNDRVLTAIVEVLKLGECSKVCRSQYMVLFIKLLSQTSITLSFKYMKCIFKPNRLVQVL